MEAKITYDELNFDRIEEAISYISNNFQEQPKLDEIARHIGMSSFYFQRLFTSWAGTTPKKFLQHISIEHAKKLLRENQSSVLDTSLETGLSGPSRLHDLFINIEGMTPGEYKNGGERLNINYSFSKSPFGNLIIASTAKGICHIAFEENNSIAYRDLFDNFPNASFTEQLDETQKNALLIFGNDWNNLEKIKLHLRGTDFQIKVWNALLTIPLGKLSTYSSIAKNIDHPKSSRAVGSAVASNSIAYLIPCHRVIRSTGIIGNYRWGSSRKIAMIGWESLKSEKYHY